MQPRTFCFTAVFVGYAVFVFSALGTPVADVEAPTLEEQNVLLDCKHSDYRTYIKCLKRQKRHHFQDGTVHPDFEPNCLTTCMANCVKKDDCDRMCSHCLRKTKQKHQIITEYETECISGECRNTSKQSEDRFGNINITTTIDIRNIINGTGTTGGSSPKECCPTCVPPVPCPQPPPPQPYPCYPPYPCPPLYPSLQLSLVPQLSFGLGISAGGGCPYPGPWPCYSGSPYPTAIDCSGCDIPYYRHKCDISCYYEKKATSPPPPTTTFNTPLCTAPHCVGGVPKG